MMTSNTKFLAQKTPISTIAHVTSLSNGGAMSLKEQVLPWTTSSLSPRPICEPVFVFAFDARLPFLSPMTAEVFEVGDKPAAALGESPRSKFAQLKPPEKVARLSDP